MKQLLNTGRGHQAPRKAAHSLQKELEQNIKDRERKELGTETSWGGSHEGEVSNSRKSSLRWVCGELWNLRGQHNWEGKKKKKSYRGHA